MTPQQAKITTVQESEEKDRVCMRTEGRAGTYYVLACCCFCFCPLPVSCRVPPCYSQWLCANAADRAGTCQTVSVSVAAAAHYRGGAAVQRFFSMLRMHRIPVGDYSLREVNCYERQGGWFRDPESLRQTHR